MALSIGVNKKMDLERKIELIMRAPTEEIVTKEELTNLLKTKSAPKHYIGLEISGLLHLASLVLIGMKINDMMNAGVKCTIFLADWHTYINNKFDGKWEKIKIASKYYEEAFRFYCPGVEIKLGSELYSEKKDFWENYIRFCKRITLARNTRCLTIMGRGVKDQLDFSQYLYPPLQAVDIEALEVDIAHAGMDQRKVHMLAREVFPSLGWKPPIAIHHHILPGLGEPLNSGLDEDKLTDLVISSKMSKSNPSTSIFIHDNEEEIIKKIKHAWCPPKIAENNPILAFAKYIIFHNETSLEIERLPKFGGRLEFDKYDVLESEYNQGNIHPADLKSAVSKRIIDIINPIRTHFENKKELLKPYEMESE